MTAITDVKELGKTPVSPEHPTGEDVRYAPQFEELQAQIDKLSVVTAGPQEVDWNRVITLCYAILSEKSKDLLVAVYLSVALMRTYKIEGLAAGAHILRDLVETFWQDMFPTLRRVRGRINAVQWWSDQINAFLQNLEIDPVPSELMTTLTADINALDEALSTQCEGAPTLLPLNQILNRLPVQQPAAPAEEPASEGAPSDQPPSSGAASSPAQPGGYASASAPASTPSAASPGSSAEAKQLTTEGLDRLFSASAYYLQHEPTNPLGYRWTRLMAWVMLNLPPHGDDGKTMLPPPDRMIKLSIEQLLASNKHQAAVLACEDHVTEFRFWLDLSRLSAEGLRAQGEPCQNALDAVELETSMFVRRLNGLEKLSFADGSPFADEKTRAWLRQIGSRQGGAIPNIQGTDQAADVVKGLAEAHALAAQNQPAKAVSLLQDKLSQANTGRLKLLWRIALTELLLDIGKREIAASIVSQILNDIDAFHVEAFDPDLALRGLVAAYKVLSESKKSAELDKAADALDRITRLDPSEGIKLAGPV